MTKVMTKFPIELDATIDQLDDLDQIEAERIAIDSSLRVIMDRATERYEKIHARQRRWWEAFFARHGISDDSRVQIDRRGGKVVAELRQSQENKGTIVERIFGRKESASS